MRNVKQDIQLIDGFKNASNENKLKIFDVLYILDDKDIWKDLIYYKDAPELRKYHALSFKDLLTKVFGVSHVIYLRMRDSLREIPEWRKLCSTFGWEHNMACLINRSVAERDAILAEKAKGTRKSLYAIFRQLYPNAKNKVEPVDNGWKVKYLKMKKKYEKVVKERDTYKEKYSQVEKLFANEATG